MIVRRFTHALVLTAALAMGAACGGSGSEPTGPDGGTGAPEDGGEAACELLTDDEITETIGEHDGGQHDYAFGGCVWSAKAPVQDGFTEQIHATVLSADLFRDLAGIEVGDPIAGFGEGATYSPRHGQLWWQCGDQWCGVKVAVVLGDEIEEIARRLARSLDSRQ